MKKYRILFAAIITTILPGYSQMMTINNPFKSPTKLQADSIFQITMKSCNWDSITLNIKKIEINENNESNIRTISLRMPDSIQKFIEKNTDSITTRKIEGCLDGYGFDSFIQFCSPDKNVKLLFSCSDYSLAGIIQGYETYMLYLNGRAEKYIDKVIQKERK